MQMGERSVHFKRRDSVSMSLPVRPHFRLSAFGLKREWWVAGGKGFFLYPSLSLNGKRPPELPSYHPKTASSNQTG
ncbi:hypothetical protein AtDm6_1695 [Acetobacter tropicalis]|uniref:Uncharacterized protein n=1 Tax=Acetobacter tropicalis TaxID=104102 RepID=A0A094YML3_9PROT|nr:hypothetical protein AtDm6_1695 [Acetobacter tropicalis]